MKFKTAGIACLSALLGIFVYARAQSAASSHAQVVGLPGRYELTTATIEKVVPEPQKVVLKIDTQTGQVWMLSLHGDASGASVLFWDPIQGSEFKPR